jgi:hypothetical protein
LRDASSQKVSKKYKNSVSSSDTDQNQFVRRTDVGVKEHVFAYSYSFNIIMGKNIINLDY